MTDSKRKADDQVQNSTNEITSFVESYGHITSGRSVGRGFAEQGVQQHVGGLRPPAGQRPAYVPSAPKPASTHSDFDTASVFKRAADKKAADDAAAAKKAADDKAKLAPDPFAGGWSMPRVGEHVESAMDAFLTAKDQLSALAEGSLGARRGVRVWNAVSKKHWDAGVGADDVSAAADKATEKFSKRGRPQTFGNQREAARLTPDRRADERKEAGDSTVKSGGAEDYIERMKRHFKRTGQEEPYRPAGFFQQRLSKPKKRSQAEEPRTTPLKKWEIEEKERAAAAKKARLAKLALKKAEIEHQKESPGRSLYTSDPKARARSNKSLAKVGHNPFRMGYHYGDPADDDQ